MKEKGSWDGVSRIINKINCLRVRGSGPENDYSGGIIRNDRD